MSLCGILLNHQWLSVLPFCQIVLFFLPKCSLLFSKVCFYNLCRRNNKDPAYAYCITRTGLQAIIIIKNQDKQTNNLFPYCRTSYSVLRFQSWSGSHENNNVQSGKRFLGNRGWNSGFAERKAVIHVGFLIQIFCASIDWDAKLSLSLNKFLILAAMWTNANLKATNKKNKSARDSYARGKGLITIWRKDKHGEAFVMHAFMWLN